MTLSSAEETIVEGGDVTLTATVNPTVPVESRTVTWSSSDENVATVTDGGVVDGVAAGTATITASITVDGIVYKDTCIVTVTTE